MKKNKTKKVGKPKHSLLIWIVAVQAVLIAVFLLSTCKSDNAGDLPVDTNPDKGMAVVGRNVTFNPNKLINEGKPIELEFWTWGALDEFTAMTEEYSAIYPNVSFKMVEHPWDDYFTKLPLALQSGTGPDVFNFHNSNHANLINHMAAYDIDLDDMRKDFIGVDSHLEKGRLKYTDYSIMTGSIFYNKRLWKEAGLTEADIPRSWEEFRSVAKKLTRYDKNNQIVQAGFNYNGMYQALIEGLNYQKGQLLFAEDKTTANINNSVTIENTRFLVDLYESDRVGSKDFGNDCLATFGQEKAAMVYAWGWFVNWVGDNYPDVEYGVINLPTPTGGVPFAYDRYNGESTFGISKYSSEAKQEAAQDFMRFFLAHDKYIKKFSLMFGAFPAKKTISKDDEDIKNNILTRELVKIIDRTIYPGGFPATIEHSLTTAIQDIQYNGVSIEKALEDAQTKIEKDMKNSGFISVEDRYAHYNEL